MNLPELFSRAGLMYHFSEVVQGRRKKSNSRCNVSSIFPACVGLLNVFARLFSPFAASHVAPRSRSRETRVAKIRIVDWLRRRLPVQTGASVGGVGSNVRSGAAPTSGVAPRRSG